MVTPEEEMIVRHCRKYRSRPTDATERWSVGYPAVPARTHEGETNVSKHDISHQQNATITSVST